MNYEEILALLQQKFAGVRKDGLTMMARTIALQVESADEAKKIVDKLADAQVNEFVKNFRADVDKEVSNSTRTFEDGLKRKYDFVEKGHHETGNGDGDAESRQAEQGGGDSIADIVKQAVAAAVAPISEKLKSYESKNIAETRLSQLQSKLAECKDETFKAQTLKDFARMSFADDDAFAEYLNDKTADIASANQHVANSAMRATSAPLFSQKTETGVSKAVADYVASQNPDANQFAGREV